jgi:hypothetical protein
MSGLKYFDMKIEYDHMISKTSELEAENAELHTLTDRLSDLLSRTANALKGEPVDCMHSLSDLPEVAGKLRERVERYCKALEGITCHCAEGVEVFPTYKIVKACYDEAMQALKGGE